MTSDLGWFETYNKLLSCLKSWSTTGHGLLREAPLARNRSFLTLFKKPVLSGWFCSKIKIVTNRLFATPLWFCWQLPFYRHLPAWHWSFWQSRLATGSPVLSCVSINPQYWTATYTGALSSLSQGHEMNRMNVVCCFQFIYIFPWPFNIVYSPCLFYIQWYHVHNVFTKSYSEIS